MHCKYLIAAPNKVNYLNEVVYIGFYNTAMLLKMYNCKLSINFILQLWSALQGKEISYIYKVIILVHFDT